MVHKIKYDINLVLKYIGIICLETTHTKPKANIGKVKRKDKGGFCMGFLKHQEVFQGRVGKVSELREFGDNAVINVSVAESQRKKVDGQWVDDIAIWTEVTVWGDEARMIAKSDIGPGTNVLVAGTRSAREYEVDGQKRVSQQVTADVFAVAINPWSFIEKVGRVESGSRQGGQSQRPAQRPQAQRPQAAAPAADPFATNDDVFADDTSGSVFDDLNVDGSDNLFDDL